MPRSCVLRGIRVTSAIDLTLQGMGHVSSPVALEIIQLLVGPVIQFRELTTVFGHTPYTGNHLPEESEERGACCMCHGKILLLADGGIPTACSEPDLASLVVEHPLCGLFAAINPTNVCD